MNAKSGVQLADLEHELRHLRVLLREAGEQLILRHEGAIEAIIGNLASVPPGRLKPGLTGWLQDVRGLKLKPAKGRLKDLKAIVALVEELSEEVICAQEAPKRRNNRQRHGDRRGKNAGVAGGAGAAP